MNCFAEDVEYVSWLFFNWIKWIFFNWIKCQVRWSWSNSTLTDMKFFIVQLIDCKVSYVMLLYVFWVWWFTFKLECQMSPGWWKCHSTPITNNNRSHSISAGIRISVLDQYLGSQIFWNDKALVSKQKSFWVDYFVEKFLSKSPLQNL